MNGVTEPKVGKNNSLCAEINFPFEGINRNIAGAFAREGDNGSTYILHRGIIGGGKPGIGKTYFLGKFSIKIA